MLLAYYRSQHKPHPGCAGAAGVDALSVVDEDADWAAEMQREIAAEVLGGVDDGGVDDADWGVVTAGVAESMVSLQRWCRILFLSMCVRRPSVICLASAWVGWGVGERKSGRTGVCGCEHGCWGWEACCGVRVRFWPGAGPSGLL